MSYKSKTLRKLMPKARKVARLINELDSITTRLKNILPEIESMEHTERAFYNASKAIKSSTAVDNEALFEDDK